MAGGGKGGKKGPSMQEQLAAQQQALAASRPKEVQLQTTGWGGMGVNAPKDPMSMGTAVTGQGLQAPSWAQGDWAMPWWGQQAPNVGAAMLQQQDPAAWAQMTQGPQAPVAQQQAMPQAQQQTQSPLVGKARRRQLIQQANQNQGGGAYDQMMGQIYGTTGRAWPGYMPDFSGQG